MSQVVLQAHGLVKRFGGITATDHVDLSLKLGARHALIGPNGAGKTTLINLLTGILPPTEGRIELLGQDISRLPSHLRVARGAGRSLTTWTNRARPPDATTVRSCGRTPSSTTAPGPTPPRCARPVSWLRPCW